MGEVLGIGTTYYPGLVGVDENLAGLARTIMQDPGLPERYRDPGNWPPEMRAEYGDDQGVAAAARHRAAIKSHFRRAREELDRFGPDIVVISATTSMRTSRKTSSRPSACMPTTRS